MRRFAGVFWTQTTFGQASALLRACESHRPVRLRRRLRPAFRARDHVLRDSWRAKQTLDVGCSGNQRALPRRYRRTLPYGCVGGRSIRQ